MQEQRREHFHSVSVRLKECQIAMLNQKLKLDGFDTLSELVHAYIRGQFPKVEKNEQLINLLDRLRQKNIKDPLTGVPAVDFYRHIDESDFQAYLRQRYEYPKHARDLYLYFKRYADVFFRNPELIRQESPSVRAWICDCFRRFGEYYDLRYQNPELKLLIREIIERYELNRNMKTHDRLWIADDGYLKDTIAKVLSVATRGEFATLIRFALFSGLRGEEIDYAHDKPICNKLASCNCENLHVVNKRTGITIVVINRKVGQKHCYFTIVPTKVWGDFRAMPVVNYDLRKIAHKMLKEGTNGESAFMDLRKYHYNMNVRSEMKEMGAEVLAGRAKTVSARHYLLNEIDLLAGQYGKAWKRYILVAA
jgi:hypothetical protein